MITTTLLLFAVLKVVQSQLNGEFWWLNEKVAKYNRALITPPMVEHLSEFDTDDNINIVFRDENDLIHNGKDKFTTTETVKLSSVRHNKDLDANIVWPGQNESNNGNNNVAISNYLLKQSTSTTNDLLNPTKREEMPFVFPESHIFESKDKFEINKSVTSDPYFDDRPKFANVNIANVESNSLDSKNNSKIGENANILSSDAVQVQHMTNPNKLAFTTLNNSTTDDWVYNNKKSNLEDRPKFGNADVAITQNNNLIWSNSEKNTQPHNLESKDIFIFGKPSKEITNPIVNNMPAINKNENEVQFTFPKKDNIIWNNTSIPTKSTEKDTNNNIEDRPKFHNVIQVQNNHVAWTNEQETTQGHINIQTPNPSSKQNNVNNFWNKKEDALIFTYPKKDKFVWNDSRSSTTSTNKVSYTTNAAPEVSNYDYSKSQNICTYIEKNECQLRKGYVYTVELQIMLAKKAHDPNLICCILPSIDNKTNEDYSKVTFVNNPKTTRRQKRSTSVNETKEQKQRKVLLQRLSTQSQNIRLSTTQPKIVSPDDDYEDPYWNIKNTKYQEKQPVNTHKKYDYSSKDYIEDYVDELPRPGLVGIYSDAEQKKRNPSWTFNNRKPTINYGVDVVYDSVESEETFGYSTVDPRRVVSSKPKRGRPQKLTTVSDENPIDPESQIVSFQSNPDFRVFQGFKLINFAKKKNKETKTPFTNVESETKSEESEEKVVENISETDDYYDSNEDGQLFESCGRAVEISKRDLKDKQTGDADSGSHPWLALVVETKRRFNILCYATIIHPRVAITAAECVLGTSSGEITLITGLWNLNDRTRSRSRVVLIRVHPKYEAGDMANNLAILYWQQPLRLGINVQPACLSSQDVRDACIFFGWGGFDQAIRPRSRWQRATIRKCRNGLLTDNQMEKKGMFCASVQSHNSVIGKGSPLICNIDGRHSMVGFVVSHDDGLVLQSAQNWAKEAVKKLHLI